MRTWILVLGLLLATACIAWGGDVALALSLDWMLSLRVGVEAPLTPWLALRTDWGASLFGAIVGDLFAVFPVTPSGGPLRLALLVGVPNLSVIPISPPAAMVSFGGSVLLGYGFTERFGMDLRLGAGFPLFFEKDSPTVRELEDFPLGLWPDATISAFLRL